MKTHRTTTEHRAAGGNNAQRAVKDSYSVTGKIAPKFVKARKLKVAEILIKEVKDVFSRLERNTSALKKSIL